MDTAVALVQTYLQLNGYFVVTEFPVIESSGRGGRSVTDLDVLAVRFRHAGYDVIRGQHPRTMPVASVETDPALGSPAGEPDMIVGEVKEGAAHFNAATLEPRVLQIALSRFGCCPPAHAPEVARQLLDHGESKTPSGHRIRMVAFGGADQPHRERQWRTVPMSHVIRFIRTFLRDHWDVLHHAQFKDSTLGLLALLEKWDVPQDASTQP